jgi:hypothetical protein
VHEFVCLTYRLEGRHHKIAASNFIEPRTLCREDEPPFLQWLVLQRLNLLCCNLSNLRVADIRQFTERLTNTLELDSEYQYVVD